MVTANDRCERPMTGLFDSSQPRCATLPSWLSVRQVAFLIDGSPDQVRRLIKRKVLPGHRLAGQILIRTQDVRALLEARRCIQRAA
jgi:excisionase family DNA binding protein